MDQTVPDVPAANVPGTPDTVPPAPEPVTVLQKPALKRLRMKISPNRFVVGLSLVVFVLTIAFVVYVGLSENFSAPKRVRVTNVTGRSATISWVTDEATKGYVVYGTTDQFYPLFFSKIGKEIAVDDRDVIRARLDAAQNMRDSLQEGNGGAKIDYLTVAEDVVVKTVGEYFAHHVTVSGLDPEQTYYFMVGNGFRFSKSWEMDTSGGFPTASVNSFTTFADLEDMRVPNPAYGKIVSPAGDIPDGVIYMRINELPSEPLSAVLADNGSWYIDISGFRAFDGAEFGGVDENTDEEYLLVEAPGFVPQEVTIPMTMDAPADPIVMEEEQDVVESKGGGSLVSYVEAAYQEPECEAVGGQCMNENDCSGKVRSGLCPTQPINIKCCIDENDASGDDSDDDSSSSDTETDTDSSSDSPHSEGSTSCCEDPNQSGCTDADFAGCSCYGVPGECISAPGKSSGDSCNNGAGTIKIGLCPGSANIRCCYTGGEEQEPSSGGGGCGEVRCGPDKYDCWTSGEGGSRDPKCSWATCQADGTWKASSDCCGGCGDGSGSGDAIPSGGGSECPVDGNEGSKSRNQKCLDGDGCYCNIDERLYDFVECTETCPFIDADDIPGQIPPPPSEVCVGSYYPDDTCGGLEGTETPDGGALCPRCAPVVVSYQLCYECKQSGSSSSTSNSTDATGGSSPATPPSGGGSGCDFSGEGKACGDKCSGQVRESGSRKYVCTGGVWQEKISEGSCPVDVSLTGTNVGCYCDETNSVIAPGEACGGGTPPEIPAWADVSKGEQCKAKQCNCEHAAFYSIELNDWCPNITTPGCWVKQRIEPGQICNTKGYVCQCSDLGDCKCDPPSGENSQIVIDGSGVIASLREAVIGVEKRASLLSNYFRVHAQSDSQDVIIDPETGIMLFPEPGKYCVDGIEGYGTLCFYVNAGGQAVIYVDVNENGLFDERDIDISRATGITVTQENLSFYYDISQGFNFVSFPFLNEDIGTTAVEVLVNLNEVYGGSFYSIASYESGQWQVIEQRGETIYGSNDFQILPGKGYVIRSSADILVRLEGKGVAEPVPIGLIEGWNLVSVHGVGESYTAASVIDGVNLTGVVQADNLSEWEAVRSRYSGLQVETGDGGTQEVYGFDFPISGTEAYFVRVINGSGVWTPE
ncbi:MAG: fibronectin type III domain-containing protein [Candidatus Dojkabacteria bacterium]|nr:fibronectin type III domain-containing protein [Candidatus Dojkabacteria bacterium]